MSDFRLHSRLTRERWHQMSLQEQLGNVGSEVARALRARAPEDSQRLDGALDRALELMDATLADPRNRGRRKEICRAREVLLDFLLGANDYGSTAASLDAYYLQFGVAARR
jgi:hypothetical protein